PPAPPGLPPRHPLAVSDRSKRAAAANDLPKDFCGHKHGYKRICFQFINDFNDTRRRTSANIKDKRSSASAFLLIFQRRISAAAAPPSATTSICRAARTLRPLSSHYTQLACCL